MGRQVIQHPGHYAAGVTAGAGRRQEAAAFRQRELKQGTGRDVVTVVAVGEFVDQDISGGCRIEQRIHCHLQWRLRTYDHRMTEGSRQNTALEQLDLERDHRAIWRVFPNSLIETNRQRLARRQAAQVGRIPVQVLPGAARAAGTTAPTRDNWGAVDMLRPQEPHRKVARRAPRRVPNADLYIQEFLWLDRIGIELGCQLQRFGRISPDREKREHK